MGLTDIMADSLQRNLTMATWMLSDFSDADMMVRPVPGANHAAWQIGHLTVSEANIGKRLKASMAPELPAGYADIFNKTNASIDDPTKFPTKAEIIHNLTRVREATIALVKTLTPEELATQMQGPMAAIVPTHAHVVMTLIPTHMAMHIGQIQVIRRKLGKPNLL